jgi:hypothetical protein
MRQEEIERMRSVLQWKLDYCSENDFLDQVRVIKDIMWNFEILVDHSEFMTKNSDAS